MSESTLLTPDTREAFEKMTQYCDTVLGADDPAAEIAATVDQFSELLEGAGISIVDAAKLVRAVTAEDPTLAPAQYSHAVKDPTLLEFVERVRKIGPYAANPPEGGKDD